MAAGQWSLTLDPSTPKAIRDTIDFFGHVYTFDSSRVRSGQSDATMISSSRWGGIVRRKQTPWAVSGTNMIAWLGDEDGKGPILEVAIAGPSLFAAFVTAMLAICPALVAGTITAPGGGTSAVSYNHITPRAMMDNLCALFTAAIPGLVEYRVNKDFTLDAGLSTVLYPTATTPTAVAMRRNSGRDVSITGLSVTDLGVSIDAEDYITRAIVHDTTGAYTANGSPSATTYKDGRGNLVKMTKLFESSLTPTAQANALAISLGTIQQALRNEVTLSTDEFDIDRDVMVGDWIWVYDQDSNMVDTTNPVRYRGATIYPIKLRVLAITWPFEAGMSVWYRDLNGVWTDLTNYVVWDSPGATFEVGVSTRVLTKAGSFVV